MAERESILSSLIRRWILEFLLSFGLSAGFPPAVLAANLAVAIDDYCAFHVSSRKWREEGCDVFFTEFQVDRTIF